MRLLALLLVLLAVPAAASEPDHSAISDRALTGVIRPGTAAFSEAAEALARTAPPACADIDGEALRSAFHTAWDRWMAIQHLRFGPLEETDRALQIAFWPDSRGTVDRTVSRLLATATGETFAPAAFARSSVGGRGFPALERLLYGDTGPLPLTGDTRCAYASAAAADIARLAAEVEAGWTGRWADAWRTAGAPGNAVFLAPAETSQRLFAVTLGALEETARNRLGTPLGTVGKPRPRLSEARRSGRSLRQIALVLDASEATVATAFGPELGDADRARIASAYARARRDLEGVAELGSLPTALETGRIRVEVLQQGVEGIVAALRSTVGPALGIARGFNSADGD